MNVPNLRDSAYSSTALAELLRHSSPFDASAPGLFSGLLTTTGSDITVHQRFNKFLENLCLTPEQRQDGTTKANGVYRCLNARYYNGAAGSNGTFVGSWGKSTEIRPPRDIDVLFILPYEDYRRFEGRVGNKQSQLLQEVKGVLADTYPMTDMRGDGQVVMVPFESYSVEVVPAIRLTSGQFWICDTNDGGKYRTIDPVAELSAIKQSNTQTSGNTLDLIRMLKRWQEYCGVPLKSFVIELLAVEFLTSWPCRGKTSVYYDWMVRDFFQFLKQKPAYSYLLAPGSFEIIWLGEDWRSRAESACCRAEKACQFEASKAPYSAGEEWQKIFGTFIPLS